MSTTKTTTKKPKPKCRCGRVARRLCREHGTKFCQRCHCPIEHPTDQQRRAVQEPFDHKVGARKEIIPGLWLGDRFDAEALEHKGRDWSIFAIVDYPDLEMPKEPHYARFFRIFKNRDPVKHPYGSDWHDDDSIIADEALLDHIANMINMELVGNRKKVLVHCVGGVHRSPLVVAWYLYRVHNMTLEDAYDLIKSKRREIEPRLYWIPRRFHDPQIRTFTKGAA